MAVRLTIKVNDATYATLQEIAEADATSMAEIVRRSVALYKVVAEAQANDQIVKLVDEKANETTRLTLV